MQIKVQLVVCAEDGHEAQVQEVAMVEKPHQRIEHLGFTLAEAKSVLKTLQPQLVEQQATAFVAAHAQCHHCGAALGITGHHTRTFRTLFGTMTLTSPRLYHCRCQRRQTTSFRPLSSLLTESVAPELLLMETTWASLVSYGLTVDALTDFLPIEVTLDVKTVRHDTLKVAERCEAELGEEHWSFIEGCPRDWGNLPSPDGPITVGMDGGDVRHGEEKPPHVDVMVGKSRLAFRRTDAAAIPSSTCLGVGQTLDTKPQRRLCEVLQSPGHPRNPPRTCLSEGGETGRALQRSLTPPAEPGRDGCQLGRPAGAGGMVRHGGRHARPWWPRPRTRGGEAGRARPVAWPRTPSPPPSRGHRGSPRRRGVVARARAS